MKVINDLHLEAIRSAGTTPSTALALRGFAFDKFAEMLKYTDEHLVILGDLFDTHTVPLSGLLRTFKMLSDWLGKGHSLTLVPGNHDLSTTSTNMSSFQFLGKLLVDHPNVQYISGGGWVDETLGVYAISHVPNQDLLDLELSKVPACRYLLVHANYDNNFAKESDHSLNISAEQIEESPAQTIFFAHEHYYREEQRGKVFVAGNQFPMSISDCLHREDKCLHRLTAKGVERIVTWAADDYAEMDWREIVETDAQFVRIVGRATAEESADAMDIIGRYRRASKALIVGNGLKVSNNDKQIDAEVSSLEEARSFDVMAALKPLFTPEEFTILESLNNAKNS